MPGFRANLVLLVAAALLANAGAWAWFSDRGPDTPVAGFTLTDHHGEAFGPARLTGQRADYLRRQLEAVRSGERCSDQGVMAEVARRLSDEQIERFTEALGGVLQ